MGNDWDVATNSSMQFGQALQSGISQYATTSDPPPPPSSNGQYNGLLIGFSWPSFNGLGGVDSIDHYGAYEQSTSTPEFKPNIRNNILNSVDSFLNLMTLLTRLRTQIVSGLTINIICHSEGNYMMMAGLQNILASNKTISNGQAILLAADVNYGALQQIEPGVSGFDLETGISTGPGSGLAIAGMSYPVSVFYSNKDSTLDTSQITYGSRFQNLDYPHRLGREGPQSFVYAKFFPNVNAIDCSTVADGATDHPFTPLRTLYDNGWIPLKEAPTGSIDINEHGSYRFVPQILWVISQLLASGGSFKTLPYNVTQVGSTVGSYSMAYESPSSS